MVFRLSKKESVPGGFQRIAREQYDNAITHLSGPPGQRQTAVHETRKSFKRIRALLRLLREDLGDRFERENAHIRELSGILSPYRDADAMLEALDKLADAVPELNEHHMYDVAHESLQIGRASHAASGAGYAADAARVAQDLIDTRDQLASWEWPDNLGQVEHVFQTTYRKARKAGRRAMNATSVEDFHDWRKRVKDLLYQSQMLRDTQLGLPADFRKALSRLSELLGDHHDLTVFEELLIKPEIFPDQTHAAEVLFLVTQRREALEIESQEFVGELFSLKTGRFFKQLHAST